MKKSALDAQVLKHYEILFNSSQSDPIIYFFNSGGTFLLDRQSKHYKVLFPNDCQLVTVKNKIREYRSVNKKIDKRVCEQTKLYIKHFGYEIIEN